MISAILEGILIGLLLSVFIGPVFFLLIETSVKSGVRKAFIMDAGVIASDCIWIILLYWGIGTYLGPYLHSSGSVIFAGTVFMIFGIGGLYKLNKIQTTRVTKRNHALFIEGFLLNSVNPSVALFWLATTAFAIRRFKHDTNLIILYFISVFSTILIIDTFKFLMAKKLGPYLNEKRQQRLSLVTSVVMIIFGIYMIASKAI